MSKVRSEVIILKGCPIQSEGTAVAELSPGHIVELSGAENGVDVQSTAGKATLLRIATANIFVGKSIEDAYAEGEIVYFCALRPGDEAQARLAAGTASISRGDQLQLSDDGTLAPLSSGTPVAEAIEAVDNSGGTAEAFINIQAI